MKKSKKDYTVCGLLIIVLLLIAVFACMLYIIKLNEKLNTKNEIALPKQNEINNIVIEKNKETTNNVNNNITNSISNTVKENNNSNTKNNNIKNTNNSSSNNKLSWTGEYSIEDETKDYYQSSYIKFKNQKSKTIEFEMSAVHGKDKEHVNIGEVKGIAKKVSSKTNQKDGETEYNTYIFEEKIEGKSYKIKFIFNAHKTFQWVEVKQDFPNNINPYAGAGVYFDGEYEKIS